MCMLASLGTRELSRTSSCFTSQHSAANHIKQCTRLCASFQRAHLLILGVTTRTLVPQGWLTTIGVFVHIIRTLVCLWLLNGFFPLLGSCSDSARPRRGKLVMELVTAAVASLRLH